MKQLLFCNHCEIYIIHLGFECPKCGSRDVEIDREPDDIEGEDIEENEIDEDEDEYA